MTNNIQKRLDYIVSKELSKQVIPVKTAEGIQFRDAFVPKKYLEFKTVLLDGWAGYNRITIQFKIK